MKIDRAVVQKLAGCIMVAFCALAFSGCNFKVPITPSATRNVDDRLLGNWVSNDGQEKMKVRKLNDSIYICSYNGDLFQAFHSDVGNTAFISVQDIDSSERKYAYLIYTLSADARSLVMRAVNSEVIPKETNDSAAMQKLLKDNLRNPALFGDEVRFVKKNGPMSAS
jgi:hypothetical protein